MCKKCEFEQYDDTVIVDCEKIDVSIGRVKMEPWLLSVALTDTNRLLIDLFIDGGNGFAGGISMDISYCPFCGRKLT